MNRKQIIISIVGASLLTIGTVGGIWSGIDAMPQIINNIQVERNKQSEKEVIYNTKEKIEKLNIDATVSNIVVKKHDKPNIIVERSGNKEISTTTIESKNNELVIKEERKTVTKETKNVDDIVKYFIDEMYSSYSSQITVYLPEKVNADIKTDYNSIMFEDDIVSDTLNYETSSGYITLNSDMNFENLNVKSDSDISLAVDEMSGVKNVKVIANSVNIHENNSLVNESKIPENIEIKTSNKDYDTCDVTIYSNVPVAKNLVVDSTSKVEVDLPIVDYKFNFDVKASRSIEFDASDDEKYYNTPVEKYFRDRDNEERNLIKEFNGLINDETSNSKNEYFVKIRSGYTEFN